MDYEQGVVLSRVSFVFSVIVAVNVTFLQQNPPPPFFIIYAGMSLTRHDGFRIQS